MNAPYYVYAYVFDDGTTYVGLTKSPKRRDREHRRKSSKHTAVFKYAKQTGSLIPNMLILESGLCAADAQKYEGLYRDNVSDDLLLNVAPTGRGVGSVGRPETTLTPTERRARKIECSRNYRKANPEKIRKAWTAQSLRRRKRRAELKANDPEAYAKLLADSRRRCNLFYKNHPERYVDKYKRQYRKLKALGLDYYHKHHERAKEKQAEYRRAHREEINKRQWARRFLARLLMATKVKLLEYKPRKDNHET